MSLLEFILIQKDFRTTPMLMVECSESSSETKSSSSKVLENSKASTGSRFNDIGSRVLFTILENEGTKTDQHPYMYGYGYVWIYDTYV